MPPPRRASFAERLCRRLRGGGLCWLAGALRDRVFPPRLECRAALLAAAREAAALEIGGPSRVFQPRGLAPVYATARRIDNVNFAPRTAWETDLRDDGPFRFHASRPAGTQFLREATALTGLPDAAYDLVLSSHCLEHVANPLAALREWRRVTRPAGHLLLIVPDPARTFDHRRPITTLAHLEADEAQAVGEDDPTHLAEILAQHDLGRDPDAGTAEEFRTRTLDNARQRCAHHHVFDLPLLRKALHATGWTPLAAAAARPCHLVVFAQRPPA